MRKDHTDYFPESNSCYGVPPPHWANEMGLMQSSKDLSCFTPKRAVNVAFQGGGEGFQMEGYIFSEARFCRVRRALKRKSAQKSLRDQTGTNKVISSLI